MSVSVQDALKLCITFYSEIEHGCYYTSLTISLQWCMHIKICWEYC